MQATRQLIRRRRNESQRLIRTLTERLERQASEGLLFKADGTRERLNCEIRHERTLKTIWFQFVADCSKNATSVRAFAYNPDA